MAFIDESIADCERRLAQLNIQLEQLRRQAASVEGELRAFRAVRDSQKRENAPATQKRERQPSPQTNLNGPTKTEKISFSRLSPVWQKIFDEMIAAYPKRFTDGEIKEIARRNGIEPNESFRTALWHHQKRGALTRDFSDGTYVANEISARKAGVRWPHGKE